MRYFTIDILLGILSCLVFSAHSLQSSPHILFVSVPLPGHVNPLLAQAAELSQRGYKTTIATTSTLESYILQHKAPNVNFFNTGNCVKFDKDYASTLSLAREQGHLESSKTIYSWLALSHSCLFNALNRALEDSQLGEKFMFENSNSTISMPVFPNSTNHHTLSRVDFIIADIVTIAGFDLANKFSIPYAVNNADLLYVNSLQTVPGSHLVPQLLETHSLHAFRNNYFLRFCRRLVLPLIHFLIEGLTDTLSPIVRQYNMERAKSGLPSLSFSSLNSDAIIIQNTAFGLEYAQLSPPNVFMVGPCVQKSQSSLSKEDLDWLALSEDPVAFLSMGTLAQLNHRQMKAVFAGFLTQIPQVLSLSHRSSFPVRVIWKASHDAKLMLGLTALSLNYWVQSLGSVVSFIHAHERAYPYLRQIDIDSLSLIPSSRLLVTNWISSQTALFEDRRVRLFVSHCGINSAHEAVLAGGGHLQVLCIPMFGDQHDMGTRMRDAGVGAYLDKDVFTSVQFSKAVHALLAYGSTDLGKSRGIAAKAAIKLAGGVSRAADIIEAAVITTINARQVVSAKFPAAIPVIGVHSQPGSLASVEDVFSDPKTADLANRLELVQQFNNDGQDIVSWHSMLTKADSSTEAGDLSFLLVPSQSKLGTIENFSIDVGIFILCFVVMWVYCSWIVWRRFSRFVSAVSPNSLAGLMQKVRKYCNFAKRPRFDSNNRLVSSTNQSKSKVKHS